MALHQSQEVLAMAAAAAAKGPVALPQKDVCFFFCYACFPYFPRFYILFCFIFLLTDKHPHCAHPYFIA